MTISGHSACLSHLLALWNWRHLCNGKDMSAVKVIVNIPLSVFCLCFQKETRHTVSKNRLSYYYSTIFQSFLNITVLQCFHHTTKIYQRHNSTSTNVSWITQQEISKQRKHDVEQKCSYFCVGCLSPNSLMLSCKKSWRQKRGETSRLSVGVEEGEQSLALQPGQLQHIFQQKGSDISSSSLLSAT